MFLALVFCAISHLYATIRFCRAFKIGILEFGTSCETFKNCWWLILHSEGFANVASNKHWGVSQDMTSWVTGQKHNFKRNLNTNLGETGSYFMEKAGYFLMSPREPPGKKHFNTVDPTGPILPGQNLSTARKGGMSLLATNCLGSSTSAISMASF